MRRWVGPRIEDREESSEERRGQVERSKGPARMRNSDSEGFEGPWTEEGSKHRVSHADIASSACFSRCWKMRGRSGF